jgi:hypothetical protein
MDAAPPRKTWHWTLRIPWFLARWSVYLLGSLWAFGAVCYDGPMRPPDNLILAVPWAVVALVVLLFVRGPWRKGLTWVACFAAVLVPWGLKRPSNDRDWQTGWERTGWVELDGDLVTFHNFRNFDHGLDGATTVNWETRMVHLSNLRGLDYFQDNFMENGLIAHPLLSFDFGPDGRVVLDITTRREAHEAFSLFGGLYKLFELSYQFGDERDFVRVRTNVRHEPVYLYRSQFPRAQVLAVFLDTVRSQNDLRRKPRFYNVLTGNCTTSLRAQTPAPSRARFDYRMIVNGRLDELLHERGGFVTEGLDFEALRQQALINEAALVAHDDPEFSNRIRQGRTGFTDAFVPAGGPE